MKVHFIWLSGVILWNFGFPRAKPFYDVIAAVILSIMSYAITRILK